MCNSTFLGCLGEVLTTNLLSRRSLWLTPPSNKRWHADKCLLGDDREERESILVCLSLDRLWGQIWYVVLNRHSCNKIWARWPKFLWCGNAAYYEKSSSSIHVVTAKTGEGFWSWGARGGQGLTINPLARLSRAWGFSSIPKRPLGEGGRESRTPKHSMPLI